MIWKEATLFDDDEGVPTIEVTADAFDQKTEQFLTTFFVAVSIEEAIKGDVEYLTGILREAMDNTPTTDEQTDTKGVTLH